MDDIFKSIKAFLYDRSSSPLFGAFVVAWSVWNYRLFTILLSEETLNDKFTAIDDLFSPLIITLFDSQVTIWGELIHGAIIPAIATVTYIYIYPLLAKPVYEHSLKKQQELRRIKQEEEGNRLLSIEESRELYKKIGMLELQVDKDTEAYRKQIASLSDTISTLENQQPKNSSNLFDNINDADPEEYDNHIKEKIESLPDGDFELSSLFSNKNWSNLNTSNKQAIGKRTKKLVERGDFVGVIVKGKGSGNQLIYNKSTTALNTTSQTESRHQTTQDTKPKSKSKEDIEFEGFLNSGKVEDFISQKEQLLTNSTIPKSDIKNAPEAIAFGLLDYHTSERLKLSNKGKNFLKWYILLYDKKA